MLTVIVSAIVAVLALVGGGYLGYAYGRKVEAKAQVALAAAQKAVAALRFDSNWSE